ncbi:MAG TPA: PAS domain S-box protein [Chitinophagaceae bacterium]
MSDHNPKYQANTWLFIKPWIIGLFTFLLLTSACLYVTYQHYNTLKKEERQAAGHVAGSVSNRLQQALQYSLSATQSLALVIDGDGIPRNFDSIAAYIFRSHKYVDVLQLVPGGVIQYVYPLKGNEAAIGYDILKDSARNKEAFKAIYKKELFFAGPLQLREGGMAVIGRLPVFRNNKFWGFSAVIIRMQTLLQAAGIDTLGKTGYYFQLSRINPETKQEEFFLPIKKTPAKQEVSVYIPGGEWKLSVIAANGYKPLQDILLITIIGLMLSVTGGLFAAYLGKTPARLQQLVLLKTAELDKSEKRNKTIVNALPDLVFLIDAEGRYIDYNNPIDQKDLVPKEELIGKKIMEILPPGLAEEIMSNIEKALVSRQVVTHSYQMQVDNELLDYEARYIPQGKDVVLVLVRNVTGIKKAEERIRESEVKYRTLVEQASDGIFIANFRGEFLVVNPAGCRLSQYSEEELLKMRANELTVQAELQRIPFKFEEILSGKTSTTERKLKRKDGTLLDVEISARIIAPDRFLAFVRDISERKKAENELRRSREDLRLLSNYIETIREEERLNLSREIHDELGQQLTVLKMDVSRLTKKITGKEGSSSDGFDQVIDSINNMVETVRKISAELRPGLLDDLGLVATLEWYCNDFGKRTGIKTSFITSITEDKSPKNLAIGLFRIFQESLTNSVRHAEAKKIDVSLVWQDQQSLIMMIEDDGKGFDPGTVKDKKTLGIMGMKERAMMMGGTYNVYSTPEKGTIIEVVVPFIPEKY